MQRTFFYVKRPWLIALTSMFVSFLCCQPPRWVGAVAGEISSSVSVDHIGYIATAILMYYILQKYVVESARHLMNAPLKPVFFLAPCRLFSTCSTISPVFILIFYIVEPAPPSSSCPSSHRHFILCLSFFTMLKHKNR